MLETRPFPNQEERLKRRYSRVWFPVCVIFHVWYSALSVMQSAKGLRVSLLKARFSL